MAGRLLRDNKQLLQNIKRRTELSNICSMVSYGMGFSFTLKVDDYAVTTNRMTLYFNISDDAYTWVESKGSAFLCLDLRKVFSYSNIKYFENDIKLQFKDFNNKGWFLPSPINIDKKFNYIKNMSYFIVMNTR